MITKILQPTDANIMRCAAQIRVGKLVAFPTDTVYALGADATNAAAVKRLFEVKGRERNKPLIVAVANRSEISKVAKTVPDKAKKLIDAFMPGALTVILDKADIIPAEVTAGGDSVAVRIPDEPIALKLIALAKRPVVVPSANISGKPSPTLAEHVRADFDGKLEFILDGGQSKLGIESTVVDVRGDIPVILREGGVPREEIERVIGRTEVATVKSSSYSPRATVYFSAYYNAMSLAICDKYAELVRGGQKPVVLCLDKNADKYGKLRKFKMGKNYDDYARELFAALRRADDEGYDAVIAEGVPVGGICSALITKLVKISEGRII